MTEPEQLCQRCLQPINGGRIVLRLDIGPPGSKTQEMIVCGRCLDSYERWLTRRARHPEATRPVPEAADHPRARSGRKRKRQQAVTATEARERHAARMRVRLIGLTASIALAAYALISLLAYVLFSGK